jgi:hypothetical protein
MCINHEVDVIKHALLAVGCIVTVENPYPSEKPFDPAEKGNSRVTIKADHCPWGG